MRGIHTRKASSPFQGRYPLGAVALAVMLAFLFATFGSDLVAHAASIVPAKSMPGDWTTYLYDRNHSGYNSAEKIINPGSAKNLKQHWMIPGTNTISTQPVAANGLVY